MPSTSRLLALGALLLMAAPFATNLSADEGMWLFNGPRARSSKTNTTSKPPKSGSRTCSARFVSIAAGRARWFQPAGLVMTNHHVGADALHKISDAEHDYLKTGFPRQNAGRGNRVRRLGTQRAAKHRGRHRQSERRGQAGHGRRRIAKSPPRGDQHHRKRRV